ncbi:hypothetical protein [Demequina pelophila]|uniref:hypothetical protein n=1 Tax=Demequina pelophila TaxID=1638984 RepID=UPI0007827430|nr:hypothetical protein [Demequina pelophila]
MTMATTARRHAWLDAFCADLETAIHGRDAAALDEPATDAAIVTLPVWTFLEPRVDVGRKALDPQGGTYDLPVRIDWDGPTVLALAPGEEVTVGWRLAGLGYTDSGTTTVRAGLSERVDDALGVPASIGASVRARVAAGARLAELVEAGKGARWAAHMRLEPYAEKAMRRAVPAVSRAIAGDDDAQNLFDEQATETLLNRMTLGEGDKPGRLGALLDRCLEARTFVRVDPLAYVSRALRRDAEDMVRQEVGDPRVGGRVREILRDSEAGSMDELLEAYSERFPSDKLGVKRAVAALTAGISTGITTVPWEEVFSVLG